MDRKTTTARAWRAPGVPGVRPACARRVPGAPGPFFFMSFSFPYSFPFLILVLSCPFLSHPFLVLFHFLFLSLSFSFLFSFSFFRPVRPAPGAWRAPGECRAFPFPFLILFLAFFFFVFRRARPGRPAPGARRANAAHFLFRSFPFLSGTRRKTKRKKERKRIRKGKGNEQERGKDWKRKEKEKKRERKGKDKEEDLMAFCDQLRLGQSDAGREEATRLGLPWRSAAIRCWMVLIGLCEVQCVISHYGMASLEPLARLFKRKPVAFSEGSREVLGQSVAVAQLIPGPAAMWKEAAGQSAGHMASPSTVAKEVLESGLITKISWPLTADLAAAMVVVWDSLWLGWPSRPTLTKSKTFKF